MMNVKYPERKSILTRARAPVRPLQPNGLLLLLIAFWGWSKHRYALAFRHAHLSAQSKKAYSIFNSKPATCNNNKTAHKQWMEKIIIKKSICRAKCAHTKKGKLRKQISYALHRYDFVRSFIRWFLLIFILFYSLSNECISCGQVRA